MRLLSLTVVSAAVVASASCHNSSSPFPMPLCNGVKIEDETVEALQRWMILGNLTSQDLVKCYLERIEQTNGYG